MRGLRRKTGSDAVADPELTESFHQLREVGMLACDTGNRGSWGKEQAPGSCLERAAEMVMRWDPR